MTTPARLSPTLYELEQDQLALLEMGDDITPEAEEAYKQALAENLTKTPQKIDRSGQWIQYLEYMIRYCTDEKKRINDKQNAYKALLERSRGYVLYVIKSLGRGQDGKLKKLVGNTFTFSAQATAQKVKVLDEAQIPDEYKNVAITMPLGNWREMVKHLESLDMACQWFLDRVESTDVTVDSKRLLKALQAGTEVPGADLDLGSEVLHVK